MKINEACKELIIKILEEFGGMNTSISGMMDVQPTPLVGSVSFKREGKSKTRRVDKRCKEKIKFNKATLR